MTDLQSARASGRMPAELASDPIWKPRIDLANSWIAERTQKSKSPVDWSWAVIRNADQIHMNLSMRMGLAAEVERFFPSEFQDEYEFKSRIFNILNSLIFDELFAVMDKMEHLVSELKMSTSDSTDAIEVAMAH